MAVAAALSTVDSRSCAATHVPQDELAAAAEAMELRCVLAVVRHGDRTPKQKMKMTVTQVLRRRARAPAR